MLREDWAVGDIGGGHKLVNCSHVSTIVQHIETCLTSDTYDKCKLFDN